MAVQAVTEPTGHVEGATTKAAKNGATAGGGIGGGIGAALAAVVVFAASQFGGDWSPIEWALNVIFSAVVGAIGARWLAGKAGAETPTDQHTTVAVPVDLAATSQVTPESGVVIPDGTGEHRADVEYEEPAVDPDGYLVVDDGPAPAGSTSV